MFRCKLVLLLLSLLTFSTFATAQRSITCESNNGRRNYCGTLGRDQIAEFQRQISGSPCVRGQTWGIDRQGLWVDRGCRAVFVVRGRGEHNPPPPPVGEPGPGGWIHGGPGNNWPPSGNWNGGRWERGGACFYTGYNFTGDYFCMRRGESRPSLAGYGDRISSIRLFGGARVVVFNDRNYRNGQDGTARDIPDLRQWRVRSDPSHTWNDRISSVQVR